MSMESLDYSRIVPAWVVVVNVVTERMWGENREIRTGTKHFRPGAKIYVRQSKDESAVIVGRHRASAQWMQIWIPTRHLFNPRVELVYSPGVLAHLADFEQTHLCFDGSNQGKDLAERLLTRLIGFVSETPHEMRDKPTTC